MRRRLLILQSACRKGKLTLGLLDDVIARMREMERDPGGRLQNAMDRQVPAVRREMRIGGLGAGGVGTAVYAVLLLRPNSLSSIALSISSTSCSRISGAGFAAGAGCNSTDCSNSRSRLAASDGPADRRG